MTMPSQICKCGNHEIAGQEVSTFGSYAGQSASGALINSKIVLKDYRFNVHYLVDRDEWHFRQFEHPEETTDFCRHFGINQIYKIFHQLSASGNGKSEIVARQINLRICQQMTNDKEALQQNNIQTAYKLALKIRTSTCQTIRNSGIKTKAEI